MRTAPPRIVLALGLFIGGCAGTTPNLSTPQMQTPTLRDTGLPSRSRSVAGASPATAGEPTLPALEPVETPAATFITAPYLQLGEAATGPDQLAVVWQAPESDAAPWKVETRPEGAGIWKVATAPVSRAVRVDGVPPQRIWSVALSGLEPGKRFDYRVLRADKPVFSARARARRGPGEATQRIVLFGDGGNASDGQKRVAYQASLAQPDLVVMTGDLVYDRGRFSEYAQRFFPIYNAPAADPAAGAPLLRSVLFAASPGNHDTAYRDLAKYPDGEAYYALWAQPLNGPALSGERNTPAVQGSADAVRAFTEAAGTHYPRMGSFSFDSGTVHWTVLDANAYTDWTSPELKSWLVKDLENARRATWRFVVFHHPPFHSSPSHENDQWMRALCPTFEKYGVDIVWSGHVHNYQRSYPLRFTVTSPRDDKGRVGGTFQLDRAFDGVKNTRPKGVLYIVTGAAGAGLYDTALEETPEKWQPFTARYLADSHSLTVVDIQGKKLAARQIDENGKQRDAFTVTK
jgi:3',5'-cyclic AMP phosphodiesterase CpdA